MLSTLQLTIRCLKLPNIVTTVVFWHGASNGVTSRSHVLRLMTQVSPPLLEFRHHIEDLDSCIEKSAATI